MMKKLIIALALPILALSLTACSSDNDGAAPRQPEPLKPNLPASAGSANVKTINHEGNPDLCYDWTFTYLSDRLTSASATKRSNTLDGDKSFSYNSTLAYGEKTVTLTNNTNPSDVITLTLNGQYYIEKMKVNSNSYDYQYDMDGRITNWKITDVTNNLGESSAYYTTGQITYASGTPVKIVYTNAKGHSTTITLVPSDTLNTNGILPPNLTRELGFIGYEQLYYAGLLGRSSARLIRSATYTYDDGVTPAKTCEYKYVFDVSGNVKTCTYADGTKQVSIGYTY